jgi:hypothetical protein
MSDFATPSAPDLTNNLRLRLAALHKNEAEYPIRLTVDETEECIRVLWEFVGHMGSDVGTQGYEAHLLERARHWAQEMQTAMLAAIAYIGPNLMDGIEDALTSERLRPSQSDSS